MRISSDYGSTAAAAARPSHGELLGERVTESIDISVPRASASPWIVAGIFFTAYSFLATIGADSRWLAALGRFIAEQGSIPDSVPYASALSTGWPNVMALGELVFYAASDAFGNRGFLLLQMAGLALCMGFLVRDMRAAKAEGLAAALALSVFGFAAFGALAVIRAQIFSIALFPVLLVLLRSETRAPSRRIWLLVPLFALWANLHGSVLVGVAVAGAYLVFERARSDQRVAASVLAASALATCLTPSLFRTPLYYLGVLESEAAKQGFGLWGRISLSSPVDVLLLAGALILVVAALRARPRLWEVMALVGLAALTAQAGRNGVWLVAFAATPAARGLLRAPRPARSDARILGATVALACVALLSLILVRGPLAFTAADDLVRKAIAVAGGTPILAENQVAEQVALAGGRVWMANPMDAFSPRDQRLYLDWMEGRESGDAALGEAGRVVLVGRGSPADRRVRASGEFRELAGDSQTVLYVRAPAGAR